MLDADGTSSGARFTCAGHGERSPVSKLVFIVSREIHLIASLVRVNCVEFLAVVTLAVDERDEQASGLGAQQVFKYSRLEIGLELMPGRVLAVF